MAVLAIAWTSYTEYVTHNDGEKMAASASHPLHLGLAYVSHEVAGS